MQISDDKDRSAGIDFLRGLCVGLVVLHHINLRFKFNQIDLGAIFPRQLSQGLFWSGYFAVIVFFVISGFLIAKLSLRRWGSLDRIRLRQFYWLRVARIAPCLLLLVAVLVVLHLMQAKGFVINPARSSLSRAVLAAVTFHVNWLEGHHGYLPGCWDILWSLSIEEVFYLLFPLLCLCCRYERWLLLPLISLIVIGPLNRVALVGQDPWQDYAYLSCADAIAFGCLAALLTARVKFTPGILRVMMMLGVSAVLLIVVFRDLVVSSVLHNVGIDISVLEIGVAMILITISQGTGSAILTRWTSYIRVVGRSSYEIYLGHMLVILGLMPVIVSSKPTTITTTIWYVVLLLLSMTLGWLVRIIYSEPLNAALRSRRYYA